jgi:hypothetical protein
MNSNDLNSHTMVNGSILITSTVLKDVTSRAEEAEIGALLLNAKEGTVLPKTLEELGHHQPQTPLQTENITATGYINGKFKQKRTQAIDMRFNWVEDKHGYLDNLNEIHKKWAIQ